MKRFGRGWFVLLSATLILSSVGCRTEPQETKPPVEASAYPPLQYVDIRDTVDNFAYSNPVLPAGYYTRPADNPTAPGDTFAPVCGGTAVTDTAIGTVTDRVEPDSSLVLQGTGFDAGTVWMYGQTTADNGRYLSLETLAGDDSTITAVTEASQPYGLYLVWVQTANGYSLPVRVNAASVEWMSQTTATSGEVVSLYGTNLSYGNGTETSYVYLRPWGADETAASVPAEVIEVNPYKVTFQVPEALTADADYEVWLHNGHGGEYGWAGPQKLHVSAEEPYVWEGNTIDVTAYGATAAGGDDDTEAIQAAANAAQDGDILYFPAGNYQISRSVSIVKGLHIQGDGPDKTVIQTREGYHVRDDGVLYIQSAPTKVSGIRFVDQQTDGVTPRLLRFDGKNVPLDSSVTILENCHFEKESRGTWDTISDGIAFFDIGNVFLENCYFKMPNGIYMTGCSRVRIAGNEFCGNWQISDSDGPNMIQLNGPRFADVSENTFYAEDFKTDPDGRLEFGDRGSVRSIVVQLHAGPAKNLYIAENSAERIGNPGNNCGEIIMLEAPSRLFSSNLEKAEDTKLTFPLDLPDGITEGAVAVVVKGRGEGQWREVVSSSGKELTVQAPWNVPLDESSVVMIVNAFHNTVVYKNEFNGFSNYYEKYNAGAGIQAYGNLINFRADSNVFTNLKAGIKCTPHYDWPGSPYDQPNYATFVGTIIENNQIDNTCWGIMIHLAYGRQDNTSGEPNPARMAYNIMVRQNTITNVRQSADSGLTGLTGFGISVGTGAKSFNGQPDSRKWPGDWIKNTVLERNTISHAEISGIRLQVHQGGTILRENRFEGMDEAIWTVYEEGAEQAFQAE